MTTQDCIAYLKILLNDESEIRYHQALSMAIEILERIQEQRQPKPVVDKIAGYKPEAWRHG